MDIHEWARLMKAPPDHGRRRFMRNAAAAAGVALAAATIPEVRRVASGTVGEMIGIPPAGEQIQGGEIITDRQELASLIRSYAEENRDIYPPDPTLTKSTLYFVYHELFNKPEKEAEQMSQRVAISTQRDPYSCPQAAGACANEHWSIQPSSPMWVDLKESTVKSFQEDNSQWDRWLPFVSLLCHEASHAVTKGEWSPFPKKEQYGSYAGYSIHYRSGFVGLGFFGNPPVAEHDLRYFHRSDGSIGHLLAEVCAEITSMTGLREMGFDIKQYHQDKINENVLSFDNMLQAMVFFLENSEEQFYPWDEWLGPVVKLPVMRDYLLQHSHQGYCEAVGRHILDINPHIRDVPMTNDYQAGLGLLALTSYFMRGEYFTVIERNLFTDPFTEKDIDDTAVKMAQHLQSSTI